MQRPRARPLTGKQKAFVEAYLTSWNATMAAEEAGYKGSRADLAAVGSKLLRNNKVKAVIDERLQERAARTDEALARLWELATFDPGGLAEVMVGPTPAISMMKAKQLGVSRLIRSIKPSARGVCVEWHDPVRAIELIMRHIAPTRQEIGVKRLGNENQSNPELKPAIEKGTRPK